MRREWTLLFLSRTARFQYGETSCFRSKTLCRRDLIAAATTRTHATTAFLGALAGGAVEFDLIHALASDAVHGGDRPTHVLLSAAESRLRHPVCGHRPFRFESSR